MSGLRSVAISFSGRLLQKWFGRTQELDSPDQSNFLAYLLWNRGVDLQLLGVVNPQVLETGACDFLVQTLAYRQAKQFDSRPSIEH